MYNAMYTEKSAADLSLVWLHSAQARQCRVGHCAGGREEGRGKGYGRL